MKLRTISALVALMGSPAALAVQLPDLVVSDLTVNDQCQPVITVRNLGPGTLPDSAMYMGSSANLSMKKNGSPRGGWSMDKHELIAVGGTYTHVDKALNHVVSGQASYTATIDDSNLITEANESNNALTRTLTCTPAQPDLTIDLLEFDSECRVTITVRNIGQANMGSNYHASTNVHRTIDGTSKGSIRLADMDGQEQAAAVGGSVSWTDWPEFRPTSEARYKITPPAGSDANASNNERSINVPDRCKAGSTGVIQKEEIYLWKPQIKPKTPMRPAPK